MTNEELQQLYEVSTRRIDELETKYRSGQRITRGDCNELRLCTQRLGIVARESWINAAKPSGFPDLEQPIRLTPLPASMRSLDLGNRDTKEIH